MTSKRLILNRTLYNSLSPTHNTLYLLTDKEFEVFMRLNPIFRQYKYYEI